MKAANSYIQEHWTSKSIRFQFYKLKKKIIQLYNYSSFNQLNNWQIAAVQLGH